VPAFRLFTRAAIVAGAFLLLTVAASSASARDGQSQRSPAAESAVPGHSGVFASTSTRRLLPNGGGFAPAFDSMRQHGTPVGHLPAARETTSSWSARSSRRGRSARSRRARSPT
jgi:hypothetical protein